MNNCAEAKCLDLRDKINQICRSNGWPPGHLVLVCDSSGNCCNCACYSSTAREQNAETLDVQDCPTELAYSIQGHIDRACEELGTDSVIVAFTDGTAYRCYKL